MHSIKFAYNILIILDSSMNLTSCNFTFNKYL